MTGAQWSAFGDSGSRRSLVQLLNFSCQGRGSSIYISLFVTRARERCTESGEELQVSRKAPEEQQK